jgi:hypothetical protein
MPLQPAMLRITLHQNGRHPRLVLAGRLFGPWVGETENAWRSASCSGKKIEVDMTEVTGVDSAGRDLLVAMHRAGASLIASGAWMRALIQEVTGEQPFNSNEPQRRTENGPEHEDSRIRRDIK